MTSEEAVENMSSWRCDTTEEVQGWDVCPCHRYVKRPHLTAPALCSKSPKLSLYHLCRILYVQRIGGNGWPSHVCSCLPHRPPWQVQCFGVPWVEARQLCFSCTSAGVFSSAGRNEGSASVHFSRTALLPFVLHLLLTNATECPCGASKRFNP